MSLPQTIRDLIVYCAHNLTPIYGSFEQAEHHAWFIVEAITQQDRAQLLAYDKPLTIAQEQKLIQWLDALVNKHMPLQYLLGAVPFDNITIVVQPPILIPRQETEYWCMNLITQLKQLRNQHLMILDMCAGSGCIALALAHALPHATVYAIDIDERACAAIRMNMQHNKINNVVVIQSDLFYAVPKTLKFNLIVSNPPYIADDEWIGLDPSVTQWEDKRALVAPEHGLGILKKIITQTPMWLHYTSEMYEKKIPQLVVEIGATQAAAVVAYMQQAQLREIGVGKDLAQRDRYVYGSISNESIRACSQ